MYLSSVIVMQDGIPYNIGAVGNYPYTSNKIMFFFCFVCLFLLLFNSFLFINFISFDSVCYPHCFRYPLTVMRITAVWKAAKITSFNIRSF